MFQVMWEMKMSKYSSQKQALSISASHQYIGPAIRSSTTSQRLDSTSWHGAHHSSVYTYTWQHMNADYWPQSKQLHAYYLVLCSILRSVKSSKETEYKMDSRQIFLNSGKIPEMKFSLGNLCFLFCFKRNSHQSWSAPLRGISRWVGQHLILLLFFFVFIFQSH